MKIEICFTNQNMKMEVFEWVDLKKGPDLDRVYIYWLRKIDSEFCFQNQENKTWNEIFFLKMKKGKKKEPTSSRIEHRTYGLPGIHPTSPTIENSLEGSNF